MAASRSLAKQPLEAVKRSLIWYLSGRTAVVTILLGGAAVLSLSGDIDSTVNFPLFWLIGASYAEALISLLLLNRLSRTNFFIQVQIVWDLFFISSLVIVTGGVESLFSFVYLLVIISASFLLSRRLTILVAAGAVILYGGILDLQFFGYLHFLHLFRSVPEYTFFSSLLVHAVAFCLTAILSGTLADRWRFTEERLQRKTIDYAELERMNRTILAHIGSGLMLINPQGKIRLFNRAATAITGLTLQEVYDRDATAIFPLMNGLMVATLPLDRAEGSFVGRDGEELILGYATTIVKDSRGAELGALVTFRNLTQLKTVEEDLKRSDRLAAVGRLAAGMAHEIRNPLASISGSVQLLMEADHATSEDLHLMKIVVKEADRLNGLVTDFLNFARPRPLMKKIERVASILDQISQMLATDHRFKTIVVKQNYADILSLELDRNRIVQILWDLAINAAEAMQGEGELIFTLDNQNFPAIIVEDSGPGVSAAIKRRIFEPFFSTKESGTGLGLASVYSIMELHGGCVIVGSSSTGGARFILQFAAERVTNVS